MAFSARGRYLKVLYLRYVGTPRSGVKGRYECIEGLLENIVLLQAVAHHLLFLRGGQRSVMYSTLL